MKTIFPIIVFLILICQVSLSTTLLIQEPEEVIKRAPLIVDAFVKDIKFTIIPNSSTGYAIITLLISEFIKGSSPRIIKIRRYGINEKKDYLFSDYIPSYEIGDRVIICLNKHKKGYFKPLGLYNGRFKIVNGVIQSTDIQIQQFKEQIREILSGSIAKFSKEIPRFRIDSLTKLNTSSLNKLMSDGSHLGGQFVSFDESWSTSTIHFYYNPNDAPASTSIVTARINDAFSVWNGLVLSRIDFSYSGTMSYGQTDNNTSVILWQDWTNGVYAQEFPYPEEGGPRTKTGSDIILNNDLSFVPGGGSWYFGSSALLTRTGSQKDFADILIHELGHTLGLDHSPLTSVIMHGAGYEGTTVLPLRTLANGDKAGGVHQHPVQNLSGTLPHSVVLPSDNWSGYNSYNLTGDLFVPNNYTLHFEDDATVNLINGASRHSIISTGGTISVETGATITV